MKCIKYKMYKNNIKHLQLLKCVQYSAGGSLEVMMLRLCDRYVYRLTLAFYIWCLYLHIKITKVVFISEDDHKLVFDTEILFIDVPKSKTQEDFLRREPGRC